MLWTSLVFLVTNFQPSSSVEAEAVVTGCSGVETISPRDSLVQMDSGDLSRNLLFGNLLRWWLSPKNLLLRAVMPNNFT